MTLAITSNIVHILLFFIEALGKCCKFQSLLIKIIDVQQTIKNTKAIITPKSFWPLNTGSRIILKSFIPSGHGN